MGVVFENMVVSDTRLQTHNYACDLIKFFFALGIMSVHIYRTGVNIITEFWLCVEGFYIISGFYLARHFANLSPAFLSTSKEYASQAIRYTYQKIKKLYRYIIPVLFLQYSMYIARAVHYRNNSHSLFEDLTLYFGIFITEFLMLSSLVPDTMRLLGNLWFLSAMTIILPLLCVLFLRYREVYGYVLSWIPFVMFYTLVNHSSIATGIIALERAFCFISLGIASYYLAAFLIKQHISERVRMLLFLVEIISFLYFFFSLAFKIAINYLLIYLSLFLGITILLSGCTLSSMIKGKFVAYLGKISVPIFVSQQFIGDVIKIARPHFESYFYISDKAVIIAYFSFTILFSVLLKMIVESIISDKK